MLAGCHKGRGSQQLATAERPAGGGAAQDSNLLHADRHQRVSEASAASSETARCVFVEKNIFVFILQFIIYKTKLY